MIVDILFVVAVIGILIAIYKTKFAQKKSVQQIKAQIIRETTSIKTKQPEKQVLAQQPSTTTEWTGQASDSDNSDEQSNDDSPSGNSRMSLYKQQKKREKQQLKQAQSHFLQQQKQKRQQYEKLQQQKQREQEQKRKKQQEYIEQMRQDERKRKQQEFNKWKDMFAVEQTGVNKESQDILKRKQQQLEQNLLNYLMTRKLTLLQDASHKFSLTTKDLVQKIKKLQSQQKISGVFDQRGKYLFIEQRELDAVRNYISAKGRLKKKDMMNQCAKIIKIPDQQDADLIKLVNQVEQNA